jgi:hypothetical protein
VNLPLWLYIWWIAYSSLHLLGWWHN